MTMNASTARATLADFRSPIVTSVAGLAAMMPALFRPMIARKKPMPAAMASLRLFGMELITHSRNGVTLTMRNSMPDRNTAPSAICHGTPSPCTTPYVK